jgi:hypothetical protein
MRCHQCEKDVDSDNCASLDAYDYEICITARICEACLRKALAELKTKTPSEERTSVQIGHKHGLVVINLAGTSELEPTYVTLVPTMAREVAQQINLSADRAAAES